jgi:hypothetical protein
MERTKFTAWITSHALTTGIVKTKVLPVFDWSKGAVQLVLPRFPQFARGEGKQWHRTEGSALLMAEKMRMREIARLKAQLHRLENYKVKVITDRELWAAQ